jgi:hypothetical protein
MTEIQKEKEFCSFGNWNFEICLVFGAWDFNVASPIFNKVR